MYKCITNFWPWTGKFKTYHVISICKLVKFFKLFEFLHVFTTGCGSRGVSFTDHLAGGLEDLEGSTETKVSAGVGLLGMAVSGWLSRDCCDTLAIGKAGHSWTMDDHGHVLLSLFQASRAGCSKAISQAAHARTPECFPRRRKSFAVILAAEVTCLLIDIPPVETQVSQNTGQTKPPGLTKVAVLAVVPMEKGLKWIVSHYAKFCCRIFHFTQRACLSRSCSSVASTRQ